MDSVILNNLRAKYQNQIDISKVNIELFVNNPQGVAEHIDYSETVEKELEKIAKTKGFLLVSSSPLTRSSYHADEDFRKLQDARNKKLECRQHQ